MGELLHIKASAGAGKTYQLSLRYLKLLKRLRYPSAQNLRRIVAITFTNKAAEEMKERVLRFLKEIALDTAHGRKLAEETSLTPEEAQKWIEVIITHYSDFQIRTIDSLLFSILKALSFELDFKPEADVLFEVRKVFELIFDLLLSELEEEKALWLAALESYFNHDERGGFYPEPGLRNRLWGLFPKSKSLSPKKIDAERLKAKEAAAKQALKELLEFIEDTEPVEKALKKNLFSLNSLKRCSLADVRRRSLWKKKPEECLKKRPPLDPALKSLFIERFERFKECFLDWHKAQEEEMPFLRVAGYLPLLKRIEEKMEDYAKREGVVLGSEHWTRLVLEKLREGEIIPLVYAHFAARFAHFLFDEFQDTSRAQWEALKPLFEDALAVEGSLFLVGDVKQAIYRWRGGDWGLLEEVVQEGHFPMVEAPQIQVLTYNFRSHPELVKFFNQIFAPLTSPAFVSTTFTEEVLGKKAHPKVKKEFGENLLLAFKDHEQKPAQAPTGPAVIKIYEVQGTKDETREKIQEVFLKEVEAEWRKRKGTQGTPLAVLVRKHEEAEEVSSWLLREGFPVVTENALRLRCSRVVKGLLSFLRYLQHPEDHVSLYGFLASGLLPQGPRDERELVQVWRQGERYQQVIQEIRKGLRPFTNRRAPYELLQQLIRALELPPRLETDLSAHRPFVERLLELTHLFEIEEGPSLSKFLSFWEEGGLEEQVSLPEHVSAIRVLTVHKAKGLEFPVVFIPFTDWYPASLAPVEVYEGQLVHLKEPLSEELQKLRDEIRAEECQEALNLFYVAITRAREALYLFLNLSKGRKPLSKWVKTLIEETGLCTTELN